MLQVIWIMKSLEQRKSPLDYLAHRNNVSFFVFLIDEIEVKDILSQLQTGKSVGSFSISTDLLKILSSVIASTLAFLISGSFSSVLFPDELKIAKVIALHKKGPADNPSNYRLISLLSIFSKIFQKLVHRRLYTFLEVNKIWTLYTFGFRKKTFHPSYIN